MDKIDEMSVNAIRVLSADAIEKAKSGHPGLALDAAPMAYELWAKHMNHNPADPYWPNRDRFILSAGHASMLLYSLIHLFGYGITIDDIADFRQMGSLTPGHPEYGVTPGVDASTGPLGAGAGMGVGMAIAESHLAKIFNKEGYPVFDHYTYVLCSDGCMMEGISHEAFSLAGALKLSKLIVFYDCNGISIEGSTDRVYIDDVPKRMEAYGFKVLVVEDGNDLDAIGAAIEEAKADKEHPSMIIVKTIIGYGCPAKQGSASAHGEPLGEENVAALKENLGWPSLDPFYVPSEVYDHFSELKEQLSKKEEAWNEMFASYCEEYPEMKALWDEYNDNSEAESLYDDENFWFKADKSEASRVSSSKVLNYVKDKIPNLVGGSADLGPSNRTIMSGEGDYGPESPEGRNIHFGVRELAMTAIGNGIMLHGMLRAYVATFFVFSDYTKPMARLSSIMKLPLIFVFTHDSIGVGEDGATHQPSEQMAMLRAMPNFNVFRPCDLTETEAAWYCALTSKDTPTALVLTRQALKQDNGTSKEAVKGGYILKDCEGTPDVILIATGSEVDLAVKAKEELDKDGMKVRVVSMPCTDIFDAQPEEYKESVLPKDVRKRVAIEALMGFGWSKYTGLDGACVTMESFGKSGPQAQLFEHFGFTVEHVVEVVRSL